MSKAHKSVFALWTPTKVCPESTGLQNPRPLRTPFQQILDLPLGRWFFCSYIVVQYYITPFDPRHLTLEPLIYRSYISQFLSGFLFCNNN